MERRELLEQVGVAAGAGAAGVAGIVVYDRLDGTDVEGPLVEGVSITGSAAAGYAASLPGRDSAVFRNCTIRQNGHDRGGIRLRDAAGCEIVDSEIRTTGAPVVLHRADASVENTTIATPAGTRSIDSLEAENEVLTP